MRHILKLLAILAVVVIFAQSVARAEERYLDALGRIQTRYESLDELKPLLALTVSSLDEFPGAAEAFDAWAEPCAEYFAALNELEETLIAEGDERLTSLLADTSITGTFQFRLFLGRDAVYPVLLFPLKSEHAIPKQTLTQTQFVVPHSDGQTIGLIQYCWGAHGHWGYVTVPGLGDVIDQALAEGQSRDSHGAVTVEQSLKHFDRSVTVAALMGAESDEPVLVSLTLFCENFPQEFLQTGDFLFTSYFELIPNLMTMQGDFEMDYEAAAGLSTITLYSSIIKNLRTICEGVRQLTVQVIPDRETGGFVLSATTEYQPHSDLAEQNRIRRDHRQTLAGFYQPDDAIFAFAEGVAPRLEEKSFLVGLGHVMAAGADAHIRNQELRISTLKYAETTQGETTDDEEFSSESLSYTIGDRDHTLLKLDVDQAKLKIMASLVENVISKTLFPSLLANWQEVAVTVDGDAIVLAAVRVTNGQNVAEWIDALLKTAGDEEKNINDYPADFQAPEEACKGFRFFTATVPIPESRTFLGREEWENNDGTLDVIETRKDIKRAEWLDGKSLSYCLAVSDEVAAVAAGLSPVDAMQRLKDAIDRNEVARNAEEQAFPETVLVFAVPTPEQRQRLGVLIDDNTLWEDENNEHEESNPQPDLPDWPLGQLRVRSVLTDTSRTDRVHLSREMLESVYRVWFDGSGVHTAIKRKRNESQ